MAIVGAGLAGLTAANELSKAGIKPVVHEGSTRLGGRCFSIRSKFPGQIAEHGGEFINTIKRRSGASLRRSACSPMIPLPPTELRRTLELWRRRYTPAQAKRD